MFIDRHMRSLAILLAAAAMLTGCSNHAQTAAEKGDLRVGFIGTLGGAPAGPEGWAYKNGLLLPALRPAGITSIKFTSFPNGPDLNEAIAGHAEDLGMLGDTPAIVGKAAGLHTRLINQTSVGSDCWLIVRADGPKTLNDLKGKIVATQKGSYMARYLMGLLIDNGLLDKVRFVNLLSSDAEAALRRGDIAAYASPYGPLLESHGFRSLDEAKNHPSLLGSGVTIVTSEYYSNHPDIVTAWNHARDIGIDNLQQHQDEYYAWQAARVKLPVAIYRKVYPSRVYTKEALTPYGINLLNSTKAFLVGQHLAKSDFNVTDWAVPGVLPTSKVASAQVQEKQP